MHPLMAELHQDHRNLAQVLRMLERQRDLVQEGEPVDLRVLSDIVDYVENYPDLIHHPREDVIFRVYQERSAEGTGVIARALAEHQTLIDRTKALRASLDEWGYDSVVPRERIVALISDYLALQWNHLNLEEGSVYQLLMDGLTGEDWEFIEATMPQGSDRLFGELMRKHYENLRDQVVSFGA